jgi:hypothetical protein
VIYDKFDKLVQKEVIKILSEEFLHQTAARKVLVAIIKARKEADKKTFLKDIIIKAQH